MPRTRCICGAIHDLPDDAVGTRVRCNHCGVSMLVAETDATTTAVPLKERSEPADGCPPDHDAHEAQHGLKHSRESTFRARPEDFGYGQARPVHPAAARWRTAPRGYFEDLSWTFAFPTNPASLGPFISAFLILSVGHVCAFQLFGGALAVLFVFLGFVIWAWFSAFLIHVVQASANGEDDLPQMLSMTNILEDLVLPLVKFAVTYLLAILPAVSYLWLLWTVMTETGDLQLSPLDFLLGAFRYGDFTSLADVMNLNSLVLLLCVLAGFFMWPMLLLVASIGGITALIRFDLMVRTIVRTFPVYLMTVVLAYANVAILVFASYVRGRLAGLGIAQSLIATALLTLVEVYLAIVTMRVIGLYYHHFKKRFAWSWG